MSRKLNLIIAALAVLILGACGSQSSYSESQSADSSFTVDWNQLSFTQSLELEYANQFMVEETEDYKLITIVDSNRFLLVNEDAQIPENLPSDVQVIKKNPNRVYMVASNGFDPVAQLGAMDRIRLSGVKRDNLYIEDALKAMDSGDILYAGKYNAPDYELLLSENCDLAIENTMIYHNPETKEKLEELGIPVIVEKSSYETNPIGRLEWIKFYGLLFDREQEALEYFEQQTKLIREVESAAKETDKDIKVAFFHVNSNGMINVRKPNDYIVKLIEMAGGSYALTNLEVEEENSLSTLNMQMEDFYAYAKDADYLIYNSTIVGEINSVEELIEKNQLFEDFAAVKNGRVFCTERNFFQETSGMGMLLKDINLVINGNEKEEYNYLKRLK